MVVTTLVPTFTNTRFIDAKSLRETVGTAFVLVSLDLLAEVVPVTRVGLMAFFALLLLVVEATAELRTLVLIGWGLEEVWVAMLTERN